MTFPPPFNPDGLRPAAPGYRYLGADELPKKGDEYKLSTDWVKSTINGSSRANLTYRRALCVDDQYAPPPAEWLTPGYEIVGPVDAGSRLGVLGETDNWYEGKWWTRTGQTGTYNSPVYIRRKVLAKVAPSAPKTPTLAPNQSIVVRTHGIVALNHAVQELAFATGWKWEDHPSQETIVHHVGAHYLFLSTVKNDLYLTYGSADSTGAQRTDHLKLDAKTDMGQFIDLLAAIKSVPVAPIAPTINGHSARYVKGSHLIRFGCATIDVSLFHGSQHIMNLTSQLAGNRAVAAITLDSGVKLIKDDIKSILSYIDQVNGVNA